MGTNIVKEAETEEDHSEMAEDLEALKTMATYMRAELMRLGSGGFWLVASLPKILEEEIVSAREGRPLLSNAARGALS